MDYTSFVYSARYCFPVITALFFLIKLFGGNSCDKKHSLVLCFLCVMYFITPELDVTLSKELYMDSYIQALFVEILISGAGMLAMFSLAPFDRLAFRHALVLAFIIFINFMLTWNYTVAESPFFLNYFNELIIIASVLQITVSHNGIIESISRIIKFFRRVQNYIGWAFFLGLCWLRDLQIHTKIKD